MASSKVGVEEWIEGRLHLKAPPLFFRRDSRQDGLSRPCVPFDHGLATSHSRHGARPEPGRAGFKWREARLDFRAAERAAGQVWAHSRYCARQARWKSCLQHDVLKGSCGGFIELRGGVGAESTSSMQMGHCSLSARSCSNGGG